ncbi:NAD(+) synthase [Alkalibacter rhizosphaerae]|uniref:Glutamine-dependent NAD(+) synthetase n=1 Tax=Alkalibacter rhizosphaerae TaxID=2815577 RepID=A0A974XEB5_9FIRM|nr:NAD(+) synthase [Alkalibacter rhizosphaerae]QSX08282.1 NAD(+) synthase [Alkalibacter rhizosphaerae]
MNRQGFYRIGCAVPELKVADVDHNVEKITEMMDAAVQKEVDVLVFPELGITGYTCADLFFQERLVEAAQGGVKKIVEHSKDKAGVFVIGAPVRMFHRLYNCGVVIWTGKILGIVPKIHIPEYNEYYEKRWFSSGQDFTENCQVEYAGMSTWMGTRILFRDKRDTNMALGLEICEDLWVPIPPSSHHAMAGATVLLNLSASNDLVGKREYRVDLAKNQAARTLSAYAYASAGFGESTTDVVHGGDAFLVENGTLLAENQRFALEGSLTTADVDVERLAGERTKKQGSYYGTGALPWDYQLVEFQLPENISTVERSVWKHPFVPSRQEDRYQRCEEIFQIQTTGLMKRYLHAQAKSLVVGISGGLDSTLALLVCVKACDRLGVDRKNIKGITMPGFGTTDRTYNNALALMEQLHIHWEEISIVEATMGHFEDIGHDPQIHDVTYENAQARERTQILMDLANKYNGLVVGTGDLSELALGWATYNGDHMSMYGVNSGIPKTLVRYMVDWVADNSLQEVRSILHDILDTPVSPELLPPDKDGNIAQKTEEVVGPYELHDFFLYYVVRFGFQPEKVMTLANRAFENIFDAETIEKWLKKFYQRFFSQQFKRSCLPDGPKVGSINLSPRGDWRMPSDASVAAWQKFWEK